MTIPSTIWSCWESPELESPPSLLAFVCDGTDTEDDGIADETIPFESAVCEERPPEVEVVVAPVALATGTSTEPAVTVVVDVASEFPSAILPYINIIVGILEPPY